MMRNWRLRIWWGAGLAVISAVGVVMCWHFQARGFWWFLSIMGIVSALITMLGDITAYHETKKRVTEIETHAA